MSEYKWKRVNGKVAQMVFMMHFFGDAAKVNKHFQEPLPLPPEGARLLANHIDLLEKRLDELQAERIKLLRQ